MAYFEAADIYLDAFPFVSSAAMMQAASLETPLVTRFDGPREARIFARDHPGLEGPALHAASAAKYLSHLKRLIRTPDLRQRLGKEARAEIFRHHAPPDWLEFLERAYARAAELPAIDPAAQIARMPPESFAKGEPDRSLYTLFGIAETTAAQVLKQRLGLLPTAQRIPLWRELRRMGAFSNSREYVRGLAPDWLVRVAKDR